LDVTGNKKAVIIHVPYRLGKAFKKIHVRLVRELEKKIQRQGISFSLDKYQVSLLIFES
jgi:small subunit ribosomal protein S7e